MPHQVDAAVHAVQPSHADAMRQRPAAEAHGEQLVTGHQATLTRGDLGDPLVRSASFDVHNPWHRGSLGTSLGFRTYLVQKSRDAVGARTR